MSVIKKKRIKKTSNKTPKEDKDNLEVFLERPLPEIEEVSKFEEVIEKEIATEEMDTNLSAIYRDKKGELVDVSKVNKRGRLRLLVLFKQIFILTIFICGIYGLYSYLQRPAGTGAVFLEITAPNKIAAGIPFSYDIFYRNDTGLILEDSRLEVILPESFILTESLPPASGINSWSLGNLNINEEGTISVSGYLVAPIDSANVISAKLNYIPANFSSEFKKEVSANTIISGLGFMIDVDYLNTALIGQKNELELFLRGFKDNHLSAMYLEVNASDNFKIDKLEVTPLENLSEAESPESEQSEFKLENVGENRWLLSGLPLDSEESISIPITFTLQAKNEDHEDLNLRLFKKESDASTRVLWEKTLNFEIMKSDLNLNLALNGEKTDQALSFNNLLEYNLSYSNNGEAALYDLVLMAVVKGDFINWSSLKDPLGGSVAGNTIVWTKEQIPALAELAPGSDGEINFSLRLQDFSTSDLGKNTVITSYAQYGLNNSSEEDEVVDNKSNTILSQLNSDLSLSEKLLYFNEDNIPVGSGPLPPKVGEQTSVRVFWTVKNNLHDLEEVEVKMDLPAGVEWAGTEHTNVGSVSYNSENRQLTWRLGFLPTSVYRADAEFNISLTPNESDLNKILVLSPGSTVTAIDTFTKSEVQFSTQAKTTKLEDDEIAGLSNNGRIE